MAIAMRRTLPEHEELLVKYAFVMQSIIELGDDSKPILKLVLACTKVPTRFAPGPEVDILPCKAMVPLLTNTSVITCSSLLHELDC
jgi:hypothetical protein